MILRNISNTNNYGRYMRTVSHTYSLRKIWYTMSRTFVCIGGLYYIILLLLQFYNRADFIIDQIYTYLQTYLSGLGIIPILKRTSHR